MFKPLYNYVLISRIDEENITSGGIIIPDNAKEKPSRGKVIAVGNGNLVDGKLIPLTVRENDVVMFSKWASSLSEIKIDGKDYILVKENDILGIME